MSLLVSDRTIISLCDHTGNWPAYYKAAGYNVRCFDLKNGDDVRLLLYMDGPIYGLLCAPPCTEFANSGAQYWPAKDKDGRTAAGLSIVDACLRVVALHQELRFWALENPVGRLGYWLGDYQYSFDPCDFAGYRCEHPDWPTMLQARDKAKRGEKLTAEEVQAVKNCNTYTKKTLLWGKFNKPVKAPIHPVKVKAANGDNYSPIHMSTGGKSEKTKAMRSETPLGFAQAFFEANQ